MKRMNNIEKRSERIQHFIEVLKPLGFSCVHMEQFDHSFVTQDKLFDISALADELVVPKAIQWIYENGIEQGKIDKAKEIRKALYVKEPKTPIGETWFK